MCDSGSAELCADGCCLYARVVPRLSNDQKGGLGVALNEAAFVDVQVAVDGSRADVKLAVLSWDPTTDEPAYPTVELSLTPIGRVVAALRASAWNDIDATAEPIDLETLSEVVRSFGPTQLYGWDYIDADTKNWGFWEAHPSLDKEFSETGRTHYIHLFKESHLPDRILDLRIWFDELLTLDRHGRPIDLDEFIRRGVAWWDALYAGDSRTSAAGIIPLTPGTGANNGGHNL